MVRETGMGGVEEKALQAALHQAAPEVSSVQGRGFLC